jgi:hypothetical protein
VILLTTAGTAALTTDKARPGAASANNFKYYSGRKSKTFLIQDSIVVVLFVIHNSDVEATTMKLRFKKIKKNRRM